MSSWMDYFSNPKGQAFKKAMFEILKERYLNSEPIIDRLSVSLLTETDMNQFLKMIADVYEKAYIKAVDDQREQLEKIGLSARIVPSQTKVDN